MVTLFKQLTHSQWIMLLTVAVIGLLMMIASRAEAFPSQSSQPRGFTIGHCGWVNADNKTYSKRPRNVRIIQAKLSAMGYPVNARPNGKYNAETKAAVASFQRDYNLRADGIVNGETATKLAYVSHPIANVRKCAQPYF